MSTFADRKWLAAVLFIAATATTVSAAWRERSDPEAVVPLSQIEAGEVAKGTFAPAPADFASALSLVISVPCLAGPVCV